MVENYFPYNTLTLPESQECVKIKYQDQIFCYLIQTCVKLSMDLAHLSSFEKASRRSVWVELCKIVPSCVWVISNIQTCSYLQG